MLKQGKIKPRGNKLKRNTFAQVVEPASFYQGIAARYGTGNKKNGEALIFLKLTSPYILQPIENIYSETSIYNQHHFFPVSFSLKDALALFWSEQKIKHVEKPPQAITKPGQPEKTILLKFLNNSANFFRSNFSELPAKHQTQAAKPNTVHATTWLRAGITKTFFEQFNYKSNSLKSGADTAISFFREHTPDVALPSGNPLYLQSFATSQQVDNQRSFSPLPERAGITLRHVRSFFHENQATRHPVAPNVLGTPGQKAAFGSFREQQVQGNQTVKNSFGNIWHLQRFAADLFRISNTPSGNNFHKTLLAASLPLSGATSIALRHARPFFYENKTTKYLATPGEKTAVSDFMEQEAQGNQTVKNSFGNIWHLQRLAADLFTAPNVLSGKSLRKTLLTANYPAYSETLTYLQPSGKQVLVESKQSGGNNPMPGSYREKLIEETNTKEPARRNLWQPTYNHQITGGVFDNVFRLQNLSENQWAFLQFLRKQEMSKNNRINSGYSEPRRYLERFAGLVFRNSLKHGMLQPAHHEASKNKPDKFLPVQPLSAGLPMVAKIPLAEVFQEKYRATNHKANPDKLVYLQAQNQQAFANNSQSIESKNSVLQPASFFAFRDLLKSKVLGVQQKNWAKSKTLPIIQNITTQALHQAISEPNGDLPGWGKNNELVHVAIKAGFTHQKMRQNGLGSFLQHQENKQKSTIGRQAEGKLAMKYRNHNPVMSVDKKMPPIVLKKDTSNLLGEQLASPKVTQKSTVVTEEKHQRKQKISPLTPKETRLVANQVYDLINKKIKLEKRRRGL